MSPDWVAGTASVLMRGPIVFLAGASGLFVAGLAIYGWGRRSAFREVDEGRAAVREAIEKAIDEGPRPSPVVVVPVQRRGEH